MIQSYGLHWRVDRVFWGWQKKTGELLGAKSRSPRARPIDFRQQRGIYALYAEYQLVYLGQTGAGDDRLFNRLKAHKSDHLSERWDRFSWFGTQWVTKAFELSTDTLEVKQTVEQALDMLEAVSVAISEPRLNLQRGNWGEAIQYYQYWKRLRAGEDDEEDEDAN